MNRRAGFLVCEDYQPDSVGWSISGERWSVRTFPTESLVYHLPTELVIPVADCKVQRLGLLEGDIIEADDFGNVATVNGHKLSFWQKYGWGKLESLEWEFVQNKRERLLAFTNNPTANILSAIYPIPMGSVALLVGGAGSRKTTWLHYLLEGLVPSSNMDAMLLLVDERTHEVRAPAGVELWAATTRQSAGDMRRFADLAYKVAQRRSASGLDVVVFLDSLYRTAVLENVLGETKVGATSGGAKTDVLLEFRRRRLAVAGCSPNGGSLTVVGTNLVEEGNALSTVLAETMRGSVDVHIHLRKDGSSIDWVASFCRGLEHVPSVDIDAVQGLQGLMSRRVTEHQNRLFAKEREARKRRKDEKPIDDYDQKRFHEQAIALAGDDFELLVTQLGGELPEVIWAEAELVLASSLEQHRSPREEKPIPTVPAIQPAVVEPAHPSDDAIRAMAQQLAGTPVPANQQPAGTNPATAWERAAAKLAEEEGKKL